MKLSEKIKFLRKRKAISQQELADAAELNISYVSRLENGHHEPSIEVLKKLMAIFEVSADFLLNEDEDDPDVRVKDKSLAERIRLVDSLEKRERDAIIVLMDSLLTNQKMKELMRQKVAAS
jgi:transcriptional regulator with XRE-family HTH domain